MENTQCPICRAEMTRPTYYQRTGQGRVKKQGSLECPEDCHKTTDFGPATRARARGKTWTPKEPAHCGISMHEFETKVLFNGDLQWDYVCQRESCGHSERGPRHEARVTRS